MSEFETALRTVRRRLPVIVLSIVIAGGAAFGYAQTRQKEYSATASLLFANPGFAQDLFGSNSLGTSTDPIVAENTNTYLSSLPVVASLTSAALGGARSANVIRDELKAVGKAESSIVLLTATDRSPEMASRIANAAGRQFVAFRRDADRATLAGAIEAIKGDLHTRSTPASGGQAAQLRQLQDRLQVLETLDTGNVELVQTAPVPTAPVSPKVAEDAAAGLFLGIVIGLAFAFGLERLDDRINDRADLVGITELPVLVEIPDRTDGSTVGSGRAVAPAQVEAFGLLRASLLYLDLQRNLRTIVVTSALPDEGKTTVAIGLVASAAAVGLRSLLIEADLRKPTAGEMFGLGPSVGLSEILTHQVSFDDAIEKVALHWRGEQDAIHFDVVLAGAPPPNPPLLLESPAMAELLQTAIDQYDLVVIDTPPVGVVADAMPLITAADGVLAVAAVRFSHRRTTAQLINQLEQVHANVLGVVLNRTAAPDRSYQGYYANSMPTARAAD